MYKIDENRLITASDKMLFNIMEAVCEIRDQGKKPTVRAPVSVPIARSATVAPPRVAVSASVKK